MGKFRKAAPGGRKGGTGKKTAGAKAGGRKPSKGTKGRGKGQSKSFIPAKERQVVGRPVKRKSSGSKPEKRESEGKPFRSREGEREERGGTGLYQRRAAGGRTDSRAFDDKTPGRGDRTEKSSTSGRKPFARREDSEKPERRSTGRTSSSRSDDRRPSSRSRDEEAPRKSYDRKESPSRSDDRRPSGRSRDEEAPRKSYDRKESPSRSNDRRPSGRSRDEEAPRKSYDRKESSSKPRKGRSDGKFFRPGEDDTTEKRKRIGQDDSYKRSEPGKFERPARQEDEKKWNRKESHELYGDRKKASAPFPKKSTESFSKDDTTDGTRLNKFIANAGICSRREADEMIKVGVITVNGEVITEMGYKIQSGDIVKYNNETLRGERLVYILLNKPKDFITTTDDPEERKTVMNLIAKACKERVYPVGRLDRNTTGVLLFTNDGDIARKLTHPSFEVHKIYQVELDSPLKKEDMLSITEGITLDDGFIKVDEIAYATESRDVVGVEIHSGRNRIVRRIFEHLEYKVKKLDRVIFAGLTKKDLPRGRWRFLTEMEVANLKMITGGKKKKLS